MKLLYYILTSLLSLTTVSINLVIFFAFVREPKLRESSTNIYLFSLCICDLLIGTLVYPSLILSKLYEDITNNPADCTLAVFITCLTCIATMLHLLVISYDRYVKIKIDVYNVRTNINFRSDKIIRNLFFAWTPGFVSGAIISSMIESAHMENGCAHVVFDKGPAMTVCLMVASLFLVIPAIVGVFLNCWVYKIALDTRSSLQSRQSPDIDANSQHEHNLLYLQEHGGDRSFTVRTIAEQLGITMKNHKITLIILCVNIAYVFTWPLDSILWFIGQFNEEYCKNTWCFFFVDVNPFLGLINSLINPLIVLIMHVEVRNAIFKHVLTVNQDKNTVSVIVNDDFGVEP